MNNKKDGIREALVISLYTEIHEENNDLTAFILETKYDPKGLLSVISTSRLANQSHDGVPLISIQSVPATLFYV